MNALGSEGGWGLEVEGAREDEGADVDVDVADGWRAMAREGVAFVWGNSPDGLVGIWVTCGADRLRIHECMRFLALTLHPLSLS